MALQDMATIQALLCLVQYYFRAQTESPIWFVKIIFQVCLADIVSRHLVGLALRLCVKLRYHRKLGDSPEAKELSPYTMELRKRFFWCAYCFDRYVLIPKSHIPKQNFRKSKAHSQFRSLAIWSKLPFGISDSDIDAEVNFIA